MTPRLVGGIAAATLALGILTGVAGTIVARDATSSNTDLTVVMAGHMGGAGPASMMSGGMMSGSMMGPGSSIGPRMMTGPASSSMPGSLHDQHHPVARPDGGT